MKRVLIIIFAFLIIVFCPGQDTTADMWTYSDCGGFKSYAERLAFHRLLKKHGLHLQKMALIDYEDPEHPFYRDAKGRRCAFK